MARRTAGQTTGRGAVCAMRPTMDTERAAAPGGSRIGEHGRWTELPRTGASRIEEPPREVRNLAGDGGPSASRPSASSPWEGGSSSVSLRPGILGPMSSLLRPRSR